MWAAFVLPAIGAVVTVIGALGMVFVGDGRFIGQWSAWAVWLLGLVALIIGSGLFAVATWLTHTLSRPAAIVLVVASLGLVPLGLGMNVLPFIPETFAPIAMGVWALLFSLGWVGARRQRRPPRQPRPHRTARSVVMTRLSLALATGLVLAAIVAAPVAANHGHVMTLGNGECVLLAAHGGEDEVELPLVVFDANPNVDIAPGADRLHPLHVLVHQGVPGRAQRDRRRRDAGRRGPVPRRHRQRLTRGRRAGCRLRPPAGPSPDRDRMPRNRGQSAPRVVLGIVGGVVLLAAFLVPLEEGANTIRLLLFAAGLAATGAGLWTVHAPG